VRYLLRDGELVFDPADEVHAGVVIIRDGAVVHKATADLLERSRR
jgi:hypothetical protein